MKKAILCLLLLLALCGCAQQKEEGLKFPKVTYAREPMVTLTPEPTPTPDELQYRLDVLPVMEKGYAADVAASNGNTLLVADTDSRDYQLLWLSMNRNVQGIPEIREKKLLRQTPEKPEPEEAYIRAICSDPWGDCYYVLLGEASPLSMRFPEGEEPVLQRNEDYQGRYRLEKYSRWGELLSSLSLSNLPVDTVREMLVLKDGRLFLLGALQEDWEDEFFPAALTKDVFLTLDAESGEILHEQVREGCQVASLSTDGDKILCFLLPDGRELSGFAFLNPAEGSMEALGLAWNHGFLGEPWCIRSQGGLLRLNNQLKFGTLSPETGEFIEDFDSQPDLISPEAMERINGMGIQLRSCCDMGFHLILSLYDSPDLLLLGPA